MSIFQTIKAIIKEKPQPINPVNLLRNVEEYIIFLPENEFFLYLMLEPLLHFERKMLAREKKIIFLTNRNPSDIAYLFDSAIVKVNMSNKSSIKTTCKRLSLMYKKAAYINFNFTKNSIGKQFLLCSKPIISISAGSFSSEYNISLLYHNHYKDFLKSTFTIFCINKRTFGGFLKIRKNIGNGVAINRKLFEKYKGEKIMKPTIVDSNPILSAGDLAKLINKSEYVVSYMDRISAIGYLLGKKVITVTKNAKKLPNGIVHCQGIGGEIDYFIE